TPRPGAPAPMQCDDTANPAQRVIRPSPSLSSERMNRVRTLRKWSVGSPQSAGKGQDRVLSSRTSHGTLPGVPQPGPGRDLRLFGREAVPLRYGATPKTRVGRSAQRRLSAEHVSRIYRVWRGGGRNDGNVGALGLLDPDFAAWEHRGRGRPGDYRLRRGARRPHLAEARADRT